MLRNPTDFFTFSLYNPCVKISVVIISFNEEKKIAAALASVSWADEILVVDSESTDNTRDIAQRSGARVIVQKWLGFSRQKRFATDAAENEWIFSLDADEEVSPELKEEILAIRSLPDDEIADGYKIPRLAFYLNRPIRHGGWYPDWQLRLFNKQKGRWKDVIIHESVEMEEDAKVRKLKGDIFHYSAENAAHHHQMIGERYAPLAARQLFERGTRTSPLKVVLAAWSTFARTYILKAGFLDGFAGFCIAYFAAYHAFLKHLFLWELQNTEKVKE